MSRRRKTGWLTWSAALALFAVASIWRVSPESTFAEAIAVAPLRDAPSSAPQQDPNSKHILVGTKTIAPGQADTAKAGDDSDFGARCHAPGVVRCVGFDSAQEIAGHIDPDATGAVLPEIDPNVSASGKGSLKFTVPALSSANTSGNYSTDFSDDFSVQFDSLVNGDPKSKENEFYVQWRQRFSPEMLVPFQDSNGFKQVIIGEGDRPGHVSHSCTDIELVVEDSNQFGIPRMYHSCGNKNSKYEPLEVHVGTDQGSGMFSPQNSAPPPGKCWHSSRTAPKIPPCVGYRPNQWMTFQVHIKVGTWYQSATYKYKEDSTVQFWVAEEGKPSVMVLDFSPERKTGYDLVNTAMGVAKYGKIWLLPYQTNKNENVAHDKAYTWYDELIISRQKIADPK
jgi:hypothetical protein